VHEQGRGRKEMPQRFLGQNTNTPENE